MISIVGQKQAWHMVAKLPTERVVERAVIRKAALEVLRKETHRAASQTITVIMAKEMIRVVTVVVVAVAMAMAVVKVSNSNYIGMLR